MATNNLDAVNLGTVAVGGQINEDLMQKIFDISPEARPFCDAIGSTTSKNTLKEWVREDLAVASSANKRVDGSSSSALNDTRTGERVSNYHQIMTKTVRVSDRGRDVNTVGSSDELVRQLMKRQKELKRDEEALLTSNKIAVAGSSSVASEAAGIGGWIGTGQSATNTDRGATTGADPILSGNPGGYPTTKGVLGTKRALSEAKVKAVMEAAFLKGGNPTMFLSTPKVISLFSDHLFTTSARIATLESKVSQDTSVSGNGVGNQGGATAIGAVSIFVTNYGTLELIPDRFMEDVGTNIANAYLIDPTLWEKSYLSGYRTKTLARDGLAENREISVDVTLISTNEEGNAVIAEIDTAIAATA